MKKLSKKSPFATTHDVQTIVDKGFEKFAIIMKRSFDDVYTRLDSMVTKDEFDSFKKQTEQSLYNLQSNTTDLKDRMGRVEYRIDILDKKFDTLKDVTQNHEKRITKIETKFA